MTHHQSALSALVSELFQDPPDLAHEELFRRLLQARPPQDPPIDAYGEILGDTTVTAAMLDRLLHRSVVVTLDGTFYRLRNHHAAEAIRRATTGTNLG